MQLWNSLIGGARRIDEATHGGTATGLGAPVRGGAWITPGAVPPVARLVAGAGAILANVVERGTRHAERMARTGGGPTMVTTQGVADAWRPAGSTLRPLRRGGQQSGWSSGGGGRNLDHAWPAFPPRPRTPSTGVVPPLIDLDIAGGVVTMAAHARAADVLAALQPHGLVVPVPAMLGTTMADAVRDGGYGPLIGRLGLTSDCIVAATLRGVARGPEAAAEDDDLLWLLRGGDSDAAIDRLTLETSPLANVLAGAIVLPAERLADLLTVIGQVCAVGPDGLTITSGIADGGTGAPVAFAVAIWADPSHDARDVLRPLAALTDAPSLQLLPHRPLGAWRLIDRYAPKGRALGSLRLRSLDDETRSAIDAASRCRPSARCALVMREFFGAATRVPRWSTGFPERRAHVRLDLHGSIGGDASRERAWAAEVAERLAPLRLAAETTADEAARRQAARIRLRAAA